MQTHIHTEPQHEPGENRLDPQQVISDSSNCFHQMADLPTSLFSSRRRQGLRFKLMHECMNDILHYFDLDNIVDCIVFQPAHFHIIATRSQRSSV